MGAGKPVGAEPPGCAGWAGSSPIISTTSTNSLLSRVLTALTQPIFLSITCLGWLPSPTLNEGMMSSALPGTHDRQLPRGHPSQC